MSRHATPPPGAPTVCYACPCPPLYFVPTAELGRTIGWCEHHYWRGTDLPCPDCHPDTEAVA